MHQSYTAYLKRSKIKMNKNIYLATCINYLMLVIYFTFTYCMFFNAGCSDDSNTANRT